MKTGIYPLSETMFSIYLEFQTMKNIHKANESEDIDVAIKFIFEGGVPNAKTLVEYEVLAAVIKRSSIIWDMPCSQLTVSLQPPLETCFHAGSCLGYYWTLKMEATCSAPYMS
jgi:hypothetical protein